MANLSSKIKVYLGRKPDFREEVKIQDDMIDEVSNPYIKEWKATDKPKPTNAQLNALSSQAETLEASNQVIANRKAEYPSIEELIVALYDTEDKLALENKRASVKLKYPKENS